MHSSLDSAAVQTSLGRPTYVRKVCAYLTREDGTQLLVFRGPGHDGLQVPKGTVEADEQLGAALRREVAEESGLALEDASHVASDVWTRRVGPLTKYVRHFYHAEIDESRDRWSHVVTGGGEESGETFDYFWVDLPTTELFALSLDDYLPIVPADYSSPQPSPSATAPWHHIFSSRTLVRRERAHMLSDYAHSSGPEDFNDFSRGPATAESDSDSSSSEY